MSELESTIRVLCQDLDRGRLAVLCGAGISVHSGLPQSSSLIELLLEGIRIPRHPAQELLAAQLPLEFIMQVLSDNIDETPLFQLFETGKPNVNHIWLAKLAKRRRLCAVFTTNFDELFERALEEEGLRSPDDYTVWSCPSDTDPPDWDDGRLALVKLHGTVSNIKRMALTLERVAAGGAPDGRTKAVDRLFATGTHARVLVLGYSWSDAFDVNPQLEKSAGPLKETYFVKHWRGSKTPRVTALSTPSPAVPRGLGRGWLIEMNTDHLVEKLWTCSLDETYPGLPASSGKSGWEGYVKRWRENLELRDDAAEVTAHCAATLWFRVGRPKVAEELIKRTLRECPAAASWEGGTLNHTLALIAKNAGRYYEAMEILELTLLDPKTLINRPGSTGHWDRGVILAHLASVYARVGEWDLAERSCRESLQIAKYFKSETDTYAYQNEGSRRNTLGEILVQSGRPDEALHEFERGLQIARETGDKDTEWRTLTNLATALTSVGRTTAAILLFREAETLLDLLGMGGQAAGVQLGLARALRDNGDVEGAISCLRRAMESARRIGDARALRLARSRLKDLGELA